MLKCVCMCVCVCGCDFTLLEGLRGEFLKTEHDACNPRIRRLKRSVDISFNFELLVEIFVNEAVGHVDAAYGGKTVSENVFEGGCCG